ncbi:MAG TPA: TM2 domain-containing protein [Candidatus Saccharimonadales bacterium]
MTQHSQQKEFMPTFLFSLLLGSLGVDRFYLGKVGTGIAKLLTVGGFGVWYVIDIVLILTDQMKDAEGHKIKDVKQHRQTAGTIAAVYVSIQIIGLIIAAVYTGIMIDQFIRQTDLYHELYQHEQKQLEDYNPSVEG